MTNRDGMTDRMAQRLNDVAALTARNAELERTLSLVKAENDRLREACCRGAHLFITNDADDGGRCVVCGEAFATAGKPVGVA